MSKREDPQARQAYRVPRSPLDGFYQKGQPSAPVRIGAGNVLSVEKTTVTVVVHDSIIPGVTYYTDQEPGVGDLAEVWSLDDVLFTPGFTNVDQRPPNLVMANEPSPISVDLNIAGSFNDESWFFQEVDEPSWQREVTEQLVGLRVTRQGDDAEGILWSDSPFNVRPGDNIDFSVTASYLSGVVATMALVVCWGPESTDPLPGDAIEQVVAYDPTIDVSDAGLNMHLNVTVPESLDTFVPLRARLGLRFTTTASSEPVIDYGPWTQQDSWSGPTAPYYSAQTAFARGSSVGLPQDPVVAGSMEQAFYGALNRCGLSWGNGATVGSGLPITSGLQGVMNIYSTGTDHGPPWYGQAEAADYSLYLTAPSVYWHDYYDSFTLPEGAIDVQFEDYSPSAWVPLAIQPTLSFKDEGQGMGLYTKITVQPADSKTDGGGVPQTVDECLYGGSGLTRTITFEVPNLGANHGALVSLVLDASQSVPTPVGPFAGTNTEGGPGDNYQARQYLRAVGQISLAGVYKPPRYRFVYATYPDGGGGGASGDVELRLDFAEASKVGEKDRPIGQIWINPTPDLGGTPTCDIAPPSEECEVPFNAVSDPPKKSPGFKKVTVKAPPDSGGMVSVTGQARCKSTDANPSHTDPSPSIQFRLASDAEDGQWPPVTLSGTQHFTLLGNVRIEAGQQAQVWVEHQHLTEPASPVILDEAFLATTFLPGGHRPGVTSEASIRYWDGDQWRPPAQATVEVSYGDAEVPDVPRTPTTTTLLVSPTTAYERDIVTMTALVGDGATGQVMFSHATAADGPWTNFGTTPLTDGVATRTWVPTSLVTTYLRARYQGSPTHDASEAVGPPVTIGGRLTTKTLTTQATWLATYDPSGGSIDSGRVEQGLEDPAVGNRFTLLGYDLTGLPGDADVLTATLRCTEWEYALNPSGCTLVLGWHDHSTAPVGYSPDVFPQSEQQVIVGPLSLALDWLPRLLEESRDLFAGITVGPGTSDGSEFVGHSEGGENTWSLVVVYNTREGGP